MVQMIQCTTYLVWASHPDGSQVFVQNKVRNRQVTLLDIHIVAKYRKKIRSL